MKKAWVVACVAVLGGTAMQAGAVPDVRAGLSAKMAAKNPAVVRGQLKVIPPLSPELRKKLFQDMAQQSGQPAAALVETGSFSLTPAHPIVKMKGELSFANVLTYQTGAVVANDWPQEGLAQVQWTGKTADTMWGGVYLGINIAQGQGAMIDCTVDYYGDIQYQTNWPGQPTLTATIKPNGPAGNSHVLILTPKAAYADVTYIELRPTMSDQYMTFYGCNVTTY